MAKETVLLAEILTFILCMNSASCQWANFYFNELRAAVQGPNIVEIEHVIRKSVFVTKRDSGSLAELIKEIPENATASIIEDFSCGKGDPDVDLSIFELVTSYGRKVKIYEVETKDGYLLTMYRLKGSGDPVLLMHGLLGSADDFVTPGPGSGLAYLLADEGYDVWLGNVRGNVHSRAHRWLSPKSPKFWQFSYHDIGIYDLPAMIDMVLGETGRARLKYIGHSEGTTTFFVMCSVKPEYNKKIALMVALSPVAFMSHVKSPIIRLFSTANPNLDALLQVVGKDEFKPTEDVLKTLEENLCGDQELASVFCSNIRFILSGFDYKQLKISSLALLFHHTSDEAATKQLVHYGQGVSGDFRHFDYGVATNLATYGSFSPPAYPLEQITAPIAILHSDGGDWLAGPEDVKTLRIRLPNVVCVHRVPREQFSHMDFIWSKDLKKLIFCKLRHLLDKY